VQQPQIAADLTATVSNAFWSGDELITHLVPTASETPEDSDADGLVTDKTVIDEEATEKKAIDEEAWQLWMDQAGEMSGFGGRLRTDHVPYVGFASDFIVSLASGMTIMFFPLFFQKDCQMTPAEVQTIYFFVPIVMASLSTLGTRLAARFGRVQTILAIRFFGLFWFVALVLLYHFQANKWLVVGAYLARTGLMNCAYPLRESILMDYVPKSQRARWKSLEAISQFGWCGSAFIGGVLADLHGYTFTFIVTIIMQTVAVCVYALLGLVVSKKTPTDFREIVSQRRNESRLVS